MGACVVVTATLLKLQEYKYYSVGIIESNKVPLQIKEFTVRATDTYPGIEREHSVIVFLRNTTACTVDIETLK